MAYHRQGRARPACVLEFLDTHLKRENKYKENKICVSDIEEFSKDFIYVNTLKH